MTFFSHRPYFSCLYYLKYNYNIYDPFLEEKPLFQNK